MNAAKAEYCCIGIGPGGRHCSCCAPVPKLLKKLEHRKARHNERKMIERELNNEDD